jgi:hypothetical protein
MDKPHLSALIYGDASPDEFRPVLELVRQRVAVDNLRAAVDRVSFRQTIDRGWFPDLLIVLQSWPDQYLAGEVEELISLCPLARILCCFGPWCDSDGRTRSIWPTGVRVPAAAFASRFEHELALLADRCEVGPPLPLTASRTETFEYDFARPLARCPLIGQVCIISPDRRFREMLTLAFRTAGFALCESEQGAARAIVFDADPWDEDRAQALAKIRALHPQTQLVGCVGFPRPHIDAVLRRAGADGVWFKLSPLADLIDLCVTSIKP